MNGFEVIEVDVSAVVVNVVLISASCKWRTFEVTILTKKRTRKKIYFVLTIRTIHSSSLQTHPEKRVTWP